MTITPFGMAAPPKNKAEGSSGMAADARNQEKAGKPERQGGPRQEPKLAVEDASELPVKAQTSVKPKPRRNASSEISISWVYKKPRSAVSAACERGNVIAEANREAAEATWSTIVQEPDRKTLKQPFMSLSSELQRLGLTNVTPIVSKVLTNTDCNFNAHRLLLPRQSILDSPLMSMLTQEEREAVYREDKKKKDGELLEVLDQHGCRYQMNFKFLDSDKQYRLIGEWPEFVKHNSMHKGDLVQVGAFRSDGNLCLILLNHSLEEQTYEEKGEAEGTKDELMLEKIEARGGVGEEQTSSYTEKAGSVKEWTPKELEAAKGLLVLSYFKDGTNL